MYYSFTPNTKYYLYIPRVAISVSYKPIILFCQRLSRTRIRSTSSCHAVNFHCAAFSSFFARNSSAHLSLKIKDQRFRSHISLFFTFISASHSVTSCSARFGHVSVRGIPSTITGGSAPPSVFSFINSRRSFTALSPRAVYRSLCKLSL